MKSRIINLLITTVAAYILQKILGGVHFSGFGTTLFFVLILGVLNAFVKPILQVLSLPLTIVTLGLFSLVINAVVVLLAGKFVPGVHIDGFFWALIFSVLLSACTSIFSIEKGNKE